MRDSLGTDHDSPLTISSVVAATVMFAIAKGVSPQRIRAATSMTVSDLLHSEGWFPQETLPSVWRLIAETSPGEAVALEMASVTPTELLGPLLAAIQVSPTLRAHLELMVQYQRVASENLFIELADQGTETLLRMSHPMDTQDRGLTAEFVFAAGWRAIRPQTDHITTLLRVEFAHAPHGPVEDYATFFGAPTHFGQPINTLAFDSEALQAPRQAAQPALQAFLSGNLARLEERLGQARRDMELYTVREVIADNAAAGEWGAEQLARRMSLSLRSLQRRVQARGVSLQELINEAREAEARRLLTDPSLSTDEVAEQLGYSSPRAFRRAFKRWTGQTPGEFQRRG